MADGNSSDATPRVAVRLPWRQWRSRVRCGTV